MIFKYRFEFKDKPKEEFAVCVDDTTLEAQCPKKSERPEWARLSFHRCSHCTLNTDEVEFCPLALNIAGIIDKFKHITSYDDTTVKVACGDRMYGAITSVQRGLGSLLGLVIATSGCPHTTFLRPMARFHLPFASEEDTVYRVAGMYLLGQFFRNSDGANTPVNLEGLADLYAKVETVNKYTAKRLRAASTKDASVNALVLLDFFAKNMPYAIEEELEEIKYLFSSYLEPKE